MDMIIMMVTLCTILTAQRIPRCIVGSGNGMNDAIINKRLERAVNRYPVEPVTGDLLNIMMRQCIVRLKKNLQNGPPAVGITQAVLSQYG
jgi:hypothetical protein